MDRASGAVFRADGQVGEAGGGRRELLDKARQGRAARAEAKARERGAERVQRAWRAHRQVWLVYDLVWQECEAEARGEEPEPGVGLVVGLGQARGGTGACEATGRVRRRVFLLRADPTGRKGRWGALLAEACALALAGCAAEDAGVEGNWCGEAVAADPWVRAGWEERAFRLARLCLRGIREGGGGGGGRPADEKVRSACFMALVTLLDPALWAKGRFFEERMAGEGVRVAAVGACARVMKRLAAGGGEYAWGSAIVGFLRDSCPVHSAGPVPDSGVKAMQAVAAVRLACRPLAAAATQSPAEAQGAADALAQSLLPVPLLKKRLPLAAKMVLAHPSVMAPLVASVARLGGDLWGPADGRGSQASPTDEAAEGVYALGNLLGLAMLGPSGAPTPGLELGSITQALVRLLDVAVVAYGEGIVPPPVVEQLRPLRAIGLALAHFTATPSEGGDKKDLFPGGERVTRACVFYSRVADLLRLCGGSGETLQLLNTLAFRTGGQLSGLLWQHAAVLLDVPPGFGEGPVAAESFLRFVLSSRLRNGVPGLDPATRAAVALAFDTHAHLMLVLDDDDFYTRQVPLSLAEHRSMAATVNALCFSSFSRRGGGVGYRERVDKDLQRVLDLCERLVGVLHARHARIPFLEDSVWRMMTAEEADRVGLDGADATGSSDVWSPGAALRASRSGTASLLAARAAVSGETGEAPPLLRALPWVLSFQERVQLFQDLVAKDIARDNSRQTRQGWIQVTIHRGREIEDAFSQLNAFGPDLRRPIRVHYVNRHGLEEAGIDGGGVFKDFLNDIILQLFNPEQGLFTSGGGEGAVFPSPGGELVHGDHIYEFCGRMVGKALYERVLVEVQFADFFVKRVLGGHNRLDDLPSLDAELHRNMLTVKDYKGDVEGDLCLDFTLDLEQRSRDGRTSTKQTVELRPGGASIPVTSENRLQYLHAVADYRLNVQYARQAEAFFRGMSDLIKPGWIGLFREPKEFNGLLSGGQDAEVDVDDLRVHTKYSGGYTETSTAVHNFWSILKKDFSNDDRRKLLRFVTSCGRAPLLGFKALHPEFVLHKVPLNGSDGSFFSFGSEDKERLPSASTCFNTLKLPNYKSRTTMREKLLYAINSESGFDLS